MSDPSQNKTTEKIGALRRCLLPLVMHMAEYELVEGHPMPDDAVVLRFMGSGASDSVTAGEIRKAMDDE